MPKRSPILLVLLTMVFSACYYDNEEELYPNDFCETTAVSWSVTIQPLMQTRCAIPGCHVPGAQTPDLSNYNSVKAQADAGRIKARVIDGVPSIMPPSGRLPSCDQKKLEAWLLQGAPNN